ncbi:MAG: hypothetical protein GY701_22860 [Sulfitobacter sp.]|nr:hypothetical protein [Sulfitobacter sp.]
MTDEEGWSLYGPDMSLVDIIDDFLETTVDEEAERILDEEGERQYQQMREDEVLGRLPAYAYGEPPLTPEVQAMVNESNVRLDWLCDMEMELTLSWGLWDSIGAPIANSMVPAFLAYALHDTDFNREYPF